MYLCLNLRSEFAAVECTLLPLSSLAVILQHFLNSLVILLFCLVVSVAVGVVYSNR